MKYLVGLALLAFILVNAKFQEGLSYFNDLNLIYFFANLPLFFISMYFASCKWHLLVPQLRFLSLYKSNLASFYYSIFMPGQLGSEAIKAYRLIGKKNSALEVSCSLLVDKLIGIISLLILGSIACLLSEFYEKIGLVAIVFISISICLILSLYNSNLVIKLIHSSLKPLIKHSQTKPGTWYLKILSQLDQKIYEMQDLFARFTQDKKVLIKALLIGCASQSINILSQYCLAKSLGLDLSIFDWAWVFALMSLALLLPISFAGVGVRETSLIGIFTFINLPSEAAIAFAVGTYLLMVFYALIGYITDLIYGIE